MDTSSVKAPAEVNVNLKKRRRRRRGRGKMKTNNGRTIQNMDQKDKNVDDFESGKNGTVAKDSSQDNRLEVDLATNLSQEHPKADTVSITNPLEKSAKSKKKRRKRAKKKAESKHGPQSLDHTDIISSLSLADASGGHSDGKIKNIEGVSQESGHSMGKGSAVSLSSPSADLAEKNCELLELCRNNDTASSPTNLSLADASGGPSDGKINNIGGVSQESGHSIGKGSAVSLSNPSLDLAQKDGELLELCRSNHTASSPSMFNISSYNVCPQFSQERVGLDFGIWNREVTVHRSSKVMNGAQNYLLADRYQIPQRRKFIRPRRKLLILDVNGLLADIVSPPPLNCRADTNISGRAIFKRPFYYDFLKFCFERFDVGIWSSRSKRIIDKVVDYLLGGLKHKLLFCWDMFYCTETRFRTLENRYKPLVLKELRKLWEKHDPNLPWEKGDYDESNTLLLDDSPYKALLNPMHTGVFPCSYRYTNTSDNSLGPGGDLRVYLEGLATAENVQNYVAQHPFGQGAINEANPYWSFYSGVLQSFCIQSDKEVTKVEHACSNSGQRW